MKVPMRNSAPRIFPDPLSYVELYLSLPQPQSLQEITLQAEAHDFHELGGVSRPQTRLVPLASKLRAPLLSRPPATICNAVFLHSMRSIYAIQLL